MTKILAISDIHGEENQNLYTYLDANNIDLVLILGDITNFGPIGFVETFINKLKSYNFDVIAIHGNCDPEGVCDAIGNVTTCLHNNSIVYKDIVLSGYGGSNLTPFDTPSEVDDDKIYEDLHKLFENQTEYEDKLKILVTHAPPLNSDADVIESGDHVGSQGVFKIIEEFEPNINLCGHVHEAKSISKIANTDVANPGMLKDNGAVLITIDDNLKYEISIISLDN